MNHEPRQQDGFFCLQINEINDDHPSNAADNQLSPQNRMKTFDTRYDLHQHL